MDWTTLLILAGLSAIGSYLLAQSRKDPSPMVWGIVGLLLGPIGFILAALFAKPKLT